MRTKNAIVSAIVVVVTATAASTASAQDFRWSKAVPAGRTVQIKGTNGDIRALPSNNGEVRVEATKRAKRSNPDDVKIEVIEANGGVAVCAVYPTPSNARRPNTCTFGDDHQSNVNNNDVEVAFTVYVPRNVRLEASTVNGEVAIENLQSDVEATTVNGDINVATTGLARANTVNGSIKATSGSGAWNGALEYRTVNGSVVASFPGDLDAEVNAGTVNGDIETDWPLTVRGRFGSRNLNGVIGKGGRRLVLETVNGSIRLQKR